MKAFVSADLKNSAKVLELLDGTKPVLPDLGRSLFTQCLRITSDPNHLSVVVMGDVVFVCHRPGHATVTIGTDVPDADEVDAAFQMTANGWHVLVATVCASHVKVRVDGQLLSKTVA